MTIRIAFPVMLALACAAAPASAQQRFPRPSPSPSPSLPSAGGYVRLGGVVFDNFFQAPEGDPQEDEIGASVEAGVHKDLERGLQVRASVDYTRYRDFEPSGGLDVGLRGESRPHAFDVLAQVMRGRPSREVGDELDSADGFGLAGHYGYRMGDWEPIALAELRHESYDLSPGKENDVVTAGAAVRYRGWAVSPEVGVRFARRDVVDDDEDIRQREVYVRLRWAPSRPTYLTLRLRRRFREYSIDDDAARNFGREDTRTQAVATADFRTTSRVGANVYYMIEGSDSTDPRGEFLTQMLAAGLVLRF
jgi:hypothetical protein